MKCIERTATKWLALVAFVLLVAACTGSSSQAMAEPPASVASATSTPEAAETPTALVETPTKEPTATAVPELSQDDMAAAALAAFAADPHPENLVAWDLLDSSVFGDTVRLDVCIWDGESVYDDRRLVEYTVTADEEGKASARYIFDSSVLDTCLNTELIDSALAATRKFDTYWGGVLDDPTSFDAALGADLMTQRFLEASSESADGWVEEGVAWIGHVYDLALPHASLTDVLWRRYDVDASGVFEVVACRQLASDYGLYRGSLIVDDFTSADSAGEHAIHQYRLERLDGRWLIRAAEAIVWADCFAQPWLDGVNEWMPEPVLWAVLP